MMPVLVQPRVLQEGHRRDVREVADVDPSAAQKGLIAHAERGTPRLSGARVGA